MKRAFLAIQGSGWQTVCDDFIIEEFLSPSPGAVIFVFHHPNPIGE